MSIIGNVGGVNGVSGYAPAAYQPPPRQPDADTQRFVAQTQSRAQPAVQVTLSPEAQKALAAQQTQPASG